MKNHRSARSAVWLTRTHWRPMSLAIVAAMQSPLAGTAMAQSDTGSQQAANSTVGTGAVRGRVLNTATGEFIRNAEIRVEGTGISVYSGDGGTFRLTGVPEGASTVTVRYTGLQTQSIAVLVKSGETTQLDVDMDAIDFSMESNNSIVVAASRGGMASAIMERRAAMNAKTVIPADSFGALTMGDVGEFMKNMPGVSLVYTEVDATAVRIGGLDPKYSTFTADGARMATATSNNNSGRQNSFEQMSITGISAIELNNTLTARMDADSPAGNINLRSKYAFERKGREIRLQLGAVGTSDAGFSSVYMPDDKKHARILPSAQASYADVFLDGRAGIAFSASYNANYVQQDRIQTDWSYKPDGTAMPYQVMWRPGPKKTSRIAANLAADFKPSDDVILSLRGNYSFYDVEYFNQYQYLIFGTSTVSQLDPSSTSTHLIVNPNGQPTRLHTQYSHRYAGTPAYMITPKIEYFADNFEAVLRGSFARSQFKFRDNSKGFFQRTDSWLTNIGFELERKSEDSMEWYLKQTAGRDWSDPTSFNRDHDIGNNIRTSESDAINKAYGVNLDLKQDFDVGSVPFTIRTGAATRWNDWATDEGSNQQFQYVGPNGDLTQTDPEAVIDWTKNYQFGFASMGSGNVNQQGWRADSNYGMYDIFVSNPEYFVADEKGNLKRRLDNNKAIKEHINSAYIETEARAGIAKFNLGLRYEQTNTQARIANIRPLSEVVEAGHTVTGNSPDTLEGLLYQYNGGTYSTRKGKYDDWFLSGGVKLDFTDNLVGHVAFSQSILRPDYGNLGGVVSINDDTMIVTVPNAQLKPEHSTKYYAGLQYFFEPSGLIGASIFRLDMQDMQVTGIEVDPAAVGFDPDEYTGYIFRSAQNLEGTSTNNGLTLEYDQQLTFLPGALKGLGLRASYTYLDPDGIRVNLPKHTANWGVRYGSGGFDIQLTGNWQSEYRVSGLSNTPTTANNGILYHTDRALWNLSIGYKIDKNFELMLAGRNIFNSPDIIYSNVESRVQQRTQYGSMWNIGVKASF